MSTNMKCMLNIVAAPDCFGRQRGTALIVSLVILTLLTILGVSALNMSSIETLIARNDQQKYRDFTSAESILRQGVEFAKTLTSAPIPTGTGEETTVTGVYFYPNTGAYLDVSSSASTFSWSSTTSIAAGNGFYLVEFLGERGSEDARVLYYRVVARSDLNGTNTTLESILGVMKGS